MERNVKCRNAVVLKMIRFRISNYSFVVYPIHLFRNTLVLLDLERYRHAYDQPVSNENCDRLKRMKIFVFHNQFVLLQFRYEFCRNGQVYKLIFYIELLIHHRLTI